MGSISAAIEGVATKWNAIGPLPANGLEQALADFLPAAQDHIKQWYGFDPSSATSKAIAVQGVLKAGTCDVETVKRIASQLGYPTAMPNLGAGIYSKAFFVAAGIFLLGTASGVGIAVMLNDRTARIAAPIALASLYWGIRKARSMIRAARP